MATTPEGRLRDKIRDKIKKLRRQGVRIWGKKYHGSPMAQAGVPDFMVIIEGRHFFVECKAKDKDLTPLQAKVKRDIEDAGGLVCVVRDMDEFDVLIGE